MNNNNLSLQTTSLKDKRQKAVELMIEEAEMDFTDLYTGSNLKIQFDSQVSIIEKDASKNFSIQTIYFNSFICYKLFVFFMA